MPLQTLTRIRRAASRFALAWMVPLLVLGLWQLASLRGWMSPQILPAPALVWQTAREMWAADLLANIWVSLQRVAWGLGAGSAAGLLLGAWLGFSRAARETIAPTFFALAQTPTLAWIPLFMLVFGLGEALKFAVIFKAVLVPVTLYTTAGVIDIPNRLLEVAKALRLSRVSLLRRLLLPAALPSITAGLRLALAQGWVSLLAVELLASSEGIGYLMVEGRQLMMLDMVFVCIVVIALIGAAMDHGIHWLDTHLIRWPRPAPAELPQARGTPLRRALPLPIALLTLWWLAGYFGWVDANILAGPPQVWSTLLADVSSGELPSAIGHSLMRAGGGLLIGGLIGVAAGLALGLSRGLDRLLGPSLGSLRQVAVFAWVPLITAWFGLGEFAKVVFVALAVFFPLFVATHRAVLNTSVALSEVAAVFRLTVRQRLRYLLLPSAVSAMFTGLRIGLIYAWLSTIGAEYFMRSDVGIGSYLMTAQQQFLMARVMAGMLVVGCMGALLDMLGQRIERMASRWRVAGQGGHKSA